MRCFRIILRKVLLSELYCNPLLVFPGNICCRSALHLKALGVGFMVFLFGGPGVLGCRGVLEGLVALG